MPNYQNGKIYSIRSHSRPDLVYVGSTCRRLSERFGKHKIASNRASSKQIVELGDAYIELIENYASGSKAELNRREGELIRSMDCVNKRIEGRTHAEYLQDNKERITQHRASTQWKETRKAHDRKYRASDRGKAKQAVYQKKCRASTQECECGAVVVRGSITRHKRSSKHAEWQRIYEFIFS